MADVNDTYSRLKEFAEISLERGETSKQMYAHAKRQEVAGNTISSDYTEAVASLMEYIEKTQLRKDLT